MINIWKCKSSKLLSLLMLAIILWSLYTKKSIKNFDRNEQKYWKSDGITLLANRIVENGEVIHDKEIDDLNRLERESNIALNYYNEWKSYSNSDEWKEKGIKTCDTSLPSIEEIDFNNIFWQTIPNTNKTQYFLYNAFYDNRGTDKYVRVVVMQKELSRRSLW